MIKSFIDPTVTVSSPLTRTGLGAIGIQDATTVDKGAASFSSTNFTVTAGAVDTIQGISTSGTPQFTGLGVGTAAQTDAIIAGSRIDATTTIHTKGIYGDITGSYIAGTTTTISGLSFVAKYIPTAAAAPTRCGTMNGTMSTVTIQSDTQNTDVTVASVFSANLNVLKVGAGAAAISTLSKTTGWGRMFAASAATVSGGTILNLASFGEVAAQTVAAANWGLYILTTNSCVNKLRVGGITAPTATLDVTGNAATTTTIVAGTGFGCNGAAAQTAYASGGAAATTAGAFGFGSDAERAALTTLVANIRLALVANGILS